MHDPAAAAAPPADKPALRHRLQAERRALPDHAARSARLASLLDAWLAGRLDVTTIGAYWPIRGEFDPLPVLARWLHAPTPQAAGSTRAAHADAARVAGLPVVEPETRRMRFQRWWPGCPMAPDAYGIPEPDGTPVVVPELLLVPCVGFGPGGIRLGYGGGYYDRMLASLDPRPATLGLAFASGWVPTLEPGPHDIPLDAILTEDGLTLARDI